MLDARVLRYSLLRSRERGFSLTTELSPAVNRRYKNQKLLKHSSNKSHPVNGGVYLNVIFIHNELESE